MNRKKSVVASLVVALLAGAGLLRAQDMPAMPKPVKEHAWLKQLAGEWETDAEVMMAPGQPAMKAKGTESARMFGDFWVVTNSKAEMMGMPFNSIFTLGYDPGKKKYVGTWVDTAGHYMWKYEGTVDATGKVLTLETEGPSPMAPDKIAKFKEVIEFKSNDHKVFTSSILGDDGKWTTFVTVNARRKK
jgi:hypothetical protein